MSFINTSSVHLESILNVYRRILAYISEIILFRCQHNYINTIYLKCEDNSNSILSINSEILIFGEL